MKLNWILQGFPHHSGCPLNYSTEIDLCLFQNPHLLPSYNLSFLAPAFVHHPYDTASRKQLETF